MNKKQKKVLIRIIASLALIILLSLLPISGYFELLYLIPYGIIGYDILIKACKGIRNKQVFDENFLMMLATFGALGVGWELLHWAIIKKALRLCCSTRLESCSRAMP